MTRIALTCGDINGIGPEIAIKAINRISSRNKKPQLILIIPKNVFNNVKRIVKPEFKYHVTGDIKSVNLYSEPVIILTLKTFAQKIGKPTNISGEAAYLALKTSYKLLKTNAADAAVTAPVSKTALNLAGVKYPGQTEMFADWCGVKNFVMTFLSKNLRVGLYSIHIPLKKVPSSLNIKEFSNKLEVLFSTLRYDLGVNDPKIAVLGLNPHAGENGIIGSEEKDILEGIIKSEKYSESVKGPFPPDAFFANRRFRDYDLVFGLYHDQVLIPFKFINYGMGVNYTAGLPIIRTSPDHGTAYDISGKGIADESSMIEAFRYAEIIIKNRKSNQNVK
jgi:4-hydroxythreonine-4-phosphate dehydrogenase